MRISKINFTFLLALIWAGSAATAHADTITFTGSRDFPVGPPAAPNPARCGGGPPLLLTNHLGTGNSNLGSFASTESHCVNVVTGNISSGQFTFDFGGGNTFFGTYIGAIGTAPLPPPPPGVAAISFTYTLTGGTGSFTGATGILFGTGTITFTPGGPTSHIDISGTVNTVPEPATLLLLGSGLTTLLAAVRRRNCSKHLSDH